MALGKAGAIAGAVSQVQVPQVAKPAAALFLLTANACSEKNRFSMLRFLFCVCRLQVFNKTYYPPHFSKTGFF
jgi:hypothetical protein